MVVEFHVGSREVYLSDVAKKFGKFPFLATLCGICVQAADRASPPAQTDRFFAEPLNESLLSRGEVRCYFILGKLARMVWTMPIASNYASANPDVNDHADITFDSDVSHLRALKDIEK